MSCPLDDLDLVEWNAEPGAQNLRERCGMALAMIVGAKQRRNAAVRLHADRRRLEKPGAGAQHAGEPRRRDAGKTPHSKLCRCRAGGRYLLRACGDAQSRDSRPSPARAQRPWKIAAIVHRADRRLVRHSRYGNEIAAANVGAIDHKLSRGSIGEPLEHVAGFRTAGAAISIGRQRIGEHPGHLNANRRRSINPASSAL